MKITHIVSSLDSNQGGPPNVVLNLADTQKKIGHKVSIISQFKNLKYNNFKNLSYINLIKGSFLFKKHYIPNFDFIKKIYNGIKNSEIIHIHGVWNGVVSISFLISRFLQKKIILTPHGSLDSYNVKNKYILKKIYFYLIERFNLKYVKGFHFLTLNEYKNSRWINILKNKKILIQSNGINQKFINNLKLKKQKNFSKKVNITYLGRLNKIKNIDLQINLINYLKKRNKVYYLNIYGPNDGELHKIKKKINNLKLNKQIFLRKPVYGLKKYSILKNADIVILTSKYECNSILAIEVMSVGGLLLCTENCNLSHPAKYGAVKVSNHKIQNLVKSLDYLTINENSKMIRKNALKYAKKNLDIEINIKNILKFYKQII